MSRSFPGAEVTSMPAIPRIPLFLLECLQWLTTSVVKTPFGRLKWSYRYLDYYHKFVTPDSVCSKGCSHCCSTDVCISSLEAAYITEHIGIPADFSSPHSRNHSSPCPFLSTEKSCSIYQFRPFSCRTTRAVDPSGYCVPRNVADDAPGYGHESSVLRYIAHDIARLNGNHPEKDIRDFF